MWPSMRYIRGMNTSELFIRVSNLDNLAAFAKRHKVPLRTLTRIKASKDDYAPTAGTVALLEAAFKKDAKRVKQGTST